MDKEKFLKLSKKEMYDFAKSKKDNGEWSFDQFTKAISGWFQKNEPKLEEILVDVFGDVIELWRI